MCVWNYPYITRSWCNWIRTHWYNVGRRMTDPIIINSTTLWVSVLILSISGIIATLHFINKFWRIDLHGFINLQEKYWDITNWILCAVLVFGLFGIFSSLLWLGILEWCVDGIFTLWNAGSSNLPQVIIK
jgi:hypothetical protein